MKMFTKVKKTKEWHTVYVNKKKYKQTAAEQQQ